MRSALDTRPVPRHPLRPAQRQSVRVGVLGPLDPTTLPDVGGYALEQVDPMALAGEPLGCAVLVVPTADPDVIATARGNDPGALILAVQPDANAGRVIAALRAGAHRVLVSGHPWEITAHVRVLAARAPGRQRAAAGIR